MRRGGTGYLAACVVWCASALAVEYRLPLTLDTGFYDRKDALVRVELKFNREVHPASFMLLRKGETAPTPYYFVPSRPCAGVLWWRVKGAVDALTRVEYELRLSEGKWEEKPCGSQEIASLVAERSNLVPNPSFEQEDATPQKPGVREGGRKPAFWTLQDFAAAHQKLVPPPRSQARLSDEVAHDGKKSLRLVGEVRGDVNVHPFAFSSNFPLKPNTTYTLTYYVRVEEVGEGFKNSQLVDVQVHFLDKDGKSVAPHNSAVNRLQLVYNVAGRNKEEFLGKWVKVSASKMTSHNTAFGRVWMHTYGLAGTAFLDSIEFIEQEMGEPIKVEVGQLEKVEGK